MLTVNLLPENYRKANQTSLEQFHRAPIVWVLVSILVIIALVPTTLMMARKHMLSRFNEQIQVLQPKQLAVVQVQQFLNQLQQQEVIFKKLTQQGGHWSHRLNTLADVTPEGVWYTDLLLDREKGLIIHGSAIGEGGAEMVRVGRLVRDLKADKEFSGVVKDIQIESIKREQEKDIEIVRFTLTCSLVEGRKPEGPPPTKVQ